jgi:hypothetical protein
MDGETGEIMDFGDDDDDDVFVIDLVKKNSSLSKVMINEPLEN